MNFSTAEGLFGRLNEVEKLKIRAASPGTLDWMFEMLFRFELVGTPKEKRKIFDKTCELVQKDHRRIHEQTTFGLTWRF